MKELIQFKYSIHSLIYFFLHMQLLRLKIVYMNYFYARINPRAIHAKLGRLVFLVQITILIDFTMLFDARFIKIQDAFSDRAE